ncbi:redoxin domain-containing protein [Carboxylicivirga sp. N1Y90]|uniref:redoxin domain-containing protein n=1 Tax=Carboxylicivirga fragile TaxID=3417571 RepID=UPI003D326EA8|nr:redoxin domain-containing protein [Marinilabiliaceae bacterium N1Y90]
MNIKYIPLLFILLIATFSSNAQGHNINVSVSNSNDTSIILGYHFNKQMLVQDTAYINPEGGFTFEGNAPLKQGIYVIYLNSEKLFDVLIGKEQKLNINIDANNLPHSIIINGSNESSNFLEYQKFIQTKQREAKSIQDVLKAEEETSNKEKLQQQLRDMGDEVQQKALQLIQANPNTFLASFLQGLQEVEVPEMNAPEGTANPDSIIQQKRFDYYKAHYFDNIDFQDERFLRTPYFANKIERYLSQALVVPDTINKGIDQMIEKAEGCDEVQDYLIKFLFNWANESKVMGMDRVMVHVGEKYYLSGKADWANEEFIAKLQERVDKLKPNLIGNIAPDFKMESITGEVFRLSEIDALFTILIFWEPECGHCEKEVPRLNKEVWQKYADKGVKIIAIYTQHEKEPWQKFIEDNALEEWIHLYDPYNKSGFRSNYDIYSTPVIYILDKNKQIKAKRLAAEQIPGFLDHYLKLL